MIPLVSTVLAIATNLKYTIGLAVVFFVVFPALLHGLIGYAVAAGFNEKEENRRLREGLDD